MSLGHGIQSFFQRFQQTCVWESSFSTGTTTHVRRSPTGYTNVTILGCMYIIVLISLWRRLGCANCGIILDYGLMTTRFASWSDIIFSLSLFVATISARMVLDRSRWHVALSYYDGHTSICNYSFRAPVCISYSIDFQPSTSQGCSRNPPSKYSWHQTIEWLHFSNSPEIDGCSPPFTTAISDALKARHEQVHDVFPVSTNQNFGPPHTSLKSTEPLWSLNGKSCSFESMGIVIISRSLVLVLGSLVRYNTIQ